MTTTTFDLDAIAAELTEDGDTFERIEPDGTWTFTLHVKPDDLSPEDIEDPEVFGRYEYHDTRSPYDRDGKLKSRPSGFSAAAHKLWLAQNQGCVWYEPPSDFRKFKGSGFATVEEWEDASKLHNDYVKDVLSFGYRYVYVEVTHERDNGYARSWRTTGLGGIESFPSDDYVRSIVADELSELDLTT